MDVVGWDKIVHVYGEYCTIDGLKYIFAEHVAKAVERYDEVEFMQPMEFEVLCA